MRSIRRNGFILDREEFYNGMVAIAAPVMDGDGTYFAALRCHGPVQRSSLVDAEARKSLLFPASKEILASLFDI